MLKKVPNHFKIGNILVRFINGQLTGMAISLLRIFREIFSNVKRM